MNSVCKKKNEKITFIIHSFEAGGAERVASYLLSEWIKVGYHIDLLTFKSNAYDFYKLDNKINRFNLNCANVSNNLISSIFNNLKRIYKIRNHLKKHPADIVISFLTSTNIITILASFGLKHTLVVSERNDLIKQNQKIFWKLLMRISYSYANYIIYNNINNEKILSQFLNKSKLLYIQNPIRIPINKSVEKDKIILNVGRYVHQKNQIELIKALSLLNPNFSDWSLNLIGQGPDEPILKRMTDDLQLKNVNFIRTTSEIDFYYSQSSIFVLSSLFEGTPNVLLEAMSYGLPCIIPESIAETLDFISPNENVLVYKSGNPNDLAEKLSILIYDFNLRIRLGLAASKEVEKFSLEKIAQYWINVMSKRTVDLM